MNVLVYWLNYRAVYQQVELNYYKATNHIAVKSKSHSLVALFSFSSGKCSSHVFSIRICKAMYHVSCDHVSLRSVVHPVPHSPVVRFGSPALPPARRLLSVSALPVIKSHPCLFICTPHKVGQTLSRDFFWTKVDVTGHVQTFWDMYSGMCRCGSGNVCILSISLSHARARALTNTRTHSEEGSRWHQPHHRHSHLVIPLCGCTSLLTRKIVGHTASRHQPRN